MKNVQCKLNYFIFYCGLYFLRFDSIFNSEIKRVSERMHNENARPWYQKAIKDNVSLTYNVIYVQPHACDN